MEQTPLGFNPPQEPDIGLLLKMTPIAIPAIAIAKTVIPRKISMPEITREKFSNTDIIIFDQGSIL
jgi:hypothetical protein